MEYKTMYFLLFNAITDALAAQEQSNFGLAKEILLAAQCAGEELFIRQGEDGGTDCRASLRTGSQ